MALSVLLDSVILIDHLNGISAAMRYLESLAEASISVITRAEVLAGVPLSALPDVKGWLNRYPTFTIDRQTANLAAELRRKNKWKLPDAFQAAVATQHGLKLATRNTKDFAAARVRGCPLLQPVVRSFLRDNHVMHVTFAQPGGGYAHEPRALAQFLDGRAAAIAHAGPQSAHQLINQLGE